jgi:hypothetical protein
MASTILAVLLAPLLAARLYVLRSPREHAVSAGWLAGALVQAAFIIPLAAGGRSRLHPGSLTPPGPSLAYYAHAVLLPSLGWHASWWLRSLAGAGAATAIAAAVLAAAFALILLTQPGARPFVLAALAAGGWCSRWQPSPSTARRPSSRRFPPGREAPGTPSWPAS